MWGWHKVFADAFADVSENGFTLAWVMSFVVILGCYIAIAVLGVFVVNDSLAMLFGWRTNWMFAWLTAEIIGLPWCILLWVILLVIEIITHTQRITPLFSLVHH
jgi:hypothetical protein